MSLVAAFRYRDGQRIGPVALDRPGQRPFTHAGAKSDFVWAGLVEPTAEELAGLQRTFALHPLAIEDAGQAHQLPKLEIYGDQLFLVARTAQMDGDRIAYGETAIFVGRHHIISVRHGSARAHTQLRHQLEAAPALLEQGVDYVLHGILDFIVDGYLPIVEAIEDEVLQMESRALDVSLSREAVARIFTLRRELIRFQRFMGPTTELVSKLVHLDLPCIDPDTRPYFRDVLDHVRRVDSRIGALGDVLTSVFEVSALLEQQRQGEITRQLAAWAAILAVPTAVAGIYGMNFANMPELTTRYGYFVVLGAIALACVLLYLRFRRAGWL